MLTVQKQMGSGLGAAVFARTPGSTGKSRLAATWGRERTDIFYDHCLRCACDWLGAGKTVCTGYWALTGPGSRCTSFWKNGEILEQVEGPLGLRMIDIAERIMRRHEQWCLVGTDIPQMVPLAELQLDKLLQRADFVFAPAADGGFWLAAGRCLPTREVWAEVQYSRSDTLTQLTRKLEQADENVSFRILPYTFTDVDRESDLRPLLEELQMNLSRLSTSQQNLLSWLREVG